MTKVYACLLGNWVNLEDDPECVIGGYRVRPSIWYKEGTEIWSPFKRKEENCFYHLDYVHIEYKGKDYRINPIFIQIVEE